MGSTHSLCAKARRNTTILCWLRKPKRSLKTGFVLHIAYGRIHRFFRRSYSILYVSCQQLVLASRNWRQKSWRNSIYVTSQNLPIYLDAIRIAERTWHPSMEDGRHTVVRKMTARLSIPRSHRQFFQVTWAAYRSCKKGFNITRKRSHDPQIFTNVDFSRKQSVTWDTKYTEDAWK